MIDHVSGVVLRAVDERRLAAPEDWQADRVEARRVDHAAVVSQWPFAIEDRHVEPAVVGPIPCGPYDGSDFAARRSSSSGDEAGTRVGSKRSGAPTSSSRPWLRAHSSNVSSSRSIFKSASANRLRSPPEKSARPSRTAASRPTISTPAALSVLSSSVARSGVPTSCGDGSRRARQLLDLVVPLIPDA